MKREHTDSNRPAVCEDHEWGSQSFHRPALQDFRIGIFPFLLANHVPLSDRDNSAHLHRNSLGPFLLPGYRTFPEGGTICPRRQPLSGMTVEWTEVFVVFTNMGSLGLFRLGETEMIGTYFPGGQIFPVARNQRGFLELLANPEVLGRRHGRGRTGNAEKEAPWNPRGPSGGGNFGG